MTEPTPEPPIEGPPPETEQPPVEEEPPVDPPVEQDEPEPEPCTSVYPRDPGIVCELTVGHFDYRLPHTRHANDTVYEWE